MRRNSAGVLWFLLAWSIGLCWSQSINYDFEKDGVVELKNSNFDELVLGQNTGTWLVLFESKGGCPHCVKISPFVKGAVQGLKDKNIKVGVVNGMTIENRGTLSYRYKIFKYRYPAAFLFGKDKEKPIYSPLLISSSEEVIDLAVVLYDRPAPAKGQCGSESGTSPNSNTYELTDDNFDEVVLKCPDLFFVNFNGPYVKECARFTAEFEKAAKEFKGKAKFGLLLLSDSRAEKNYGVSRVCTVKRFPAGDKSGNPVDYNFGMLGPEKEAGLSPWIKSKVPA